LDQIVARRFDAADRGYYDWLIRNTGPIVFAMQPLVVQFLATFKDYPPSQRPSNFRFDQIVEKMQRSFDSSATRCSD